MLTKPSTECVIANRMFEDYRGKRNARDSVKNTLTGIENNDKNKILSFASNMLLKSSMNGCIALIFCSTSTPIYAQLNVKNKPMCYFHEQQSDRQRST
jgi:hypothetical protein